MQFKPKNIAELAYFVAAIRPGFKSNIQTFLAREKFNYGIPALDNLLKLEGATGNTAESSYLIYDENILRCLKFAGIPGPEAYATIKAIKKKKKDKVLVVKEKFRIGFSKYLIDHEGATEEIANDTVERAWKVIEDSASYLFCGAHAYAMACDSAYGAYLKANYPYEFYLTQLKLFTEKKKREKIAALVNEMQVYANINLTSGQFGQDNRNWLVDKEKNTISQSLSSIKYISTKAANDLYLLGSNKYEYFVDLLKDLMFKTCLDERQIRILIMLGYFKDFGRNKKLLNILEEFLKGKNKITKTLKEKTIDSRMEILKQFESECENISIPIKEQLQCENEYLNLCISKYPNEQKQEAFVIEVESKYGVRIKLYSVRKGSVIEVKEKQKTYEEKKFNVGDILLLKNGSISKKPRYIYKNGVRTIVEGETERWLEYYDII